MLTLIIVVWLCAPLDAGHECEIYTAERPASDMRDCQFRRNELALDALARAGRELRPRETIRVQCRLVRSITL